MLRQVHGERKGDAPMRAHKEVASLPGAKAVPADLSRYTYRVAIANRSLIALDEQSVTFKVKDYQIEGPAATPPWRSRSANSSAAFSLTSSPKVSAAAATTAFSSAAIVPKQLRSAQALGPGPACGRADERHRSSAHRCQASAAPVLHRMVETADVLVENFRPSVPARLGIDYPRLKPINPRLVYCGLSGYGDSGPLGEKGGFDQVLQCLSGIAVFQGAAAGTPQVVLGSVLIISPRRCSPMASPQRCTIASTAAKGNI
jgi:hypothetical protein